MRNFPLGLSAYIPLTTLTKVADASNSGSGVFNLTAPANIQAGDLLVFYDYAVDGTIPATVVPTDFTLITDFPVLLSRVVLSYKIADGSEASSTITGMNGLGTDKILIVVRGDVPIQLVTPSTVNTDHSSADPAPQVVSASAGVAPLIVLATYKCSEGAVSPRTMTPAKDNEATSGTTNFIAWKIYNSSPADVTVDMDDEGTRNILISFYLQCS